MKKIVLIDKRADENIEKNLKKFGYKVLKTCENKNIPFPLNTHPDILVHKFPDGSLIVDRDNYDYYCEIFPERKVIKASKSFGSTYRDYVSLNCLSFANYFIHNLELTDEIILNYYKRHGYTLIHVNQGYTKCSLALGSNFLITSDMGIYKKLKDITNIYLIEKGFIELKNYNYGFIGGATGQVLDKFFISGPYKEHPSKEILEKFKPQVLSEKLVDYGGILDMCVF